MFNCTDQTYKNHCIEIWNIVRSFLSHHFQDVAQNIELFWKFKTDVQINVILWQETCDSVFFQMTHEKWLNDYENLDNNDDNNDNDNNDDEFSEFTHDFVDFDTL